MMTASRMSATPQLPSTARAEARELDTLGEQSLTGPVLAAVNLDSSADALLRTAHERALAAGVPLVVCHVLPEPMRSDPLFPHHHQQRALELLEYQRESFLLLTERIERVTSRTRDEYTLVFPVDAVSSGILALADAITPGLVLLGPGHTALLVAIHERHDTLVLRPTSQGTVLGVTDLTDPALPALEAAAREARRFQRPLCLFHAIKPPRVMAPAFPPVLPELPAMPSGPEELWNVTLGAWQRLREYSRHSLNGIPVEVQVVRGWPVKEITRQTRRLPVELVVIANHPKTGLAGLLRWNMMQELLTTTPCSVLVVKRGEC